MIRFMLSIALVFAFFGSASAQFSGQPIPRPKHLEYPVHRVPHKVPEARIVDVTPVPSSSDEVFQPPVRTFADEATPVPGSMKPQPSTRKWEVTQHIIPAGWERDQFGKFVFREEQVMERWVEVTPQPVVESRPIRHTTIYPNWDAELERINSESEQEATPRSDTWQPIRPRIQLPDDEQSSELPRRLELPQVREPVPADQRPSLQQPTQPKQNERPSIRYTGPSTLVRLKPITP